MSDDSGVEVRHTLYRCTECGAESLSIGKLHAHIEKHRGLFGIQWPWKVGDADELMESTEIVELVEEETYTGDEAREYVGRYEVVKHV